MLRLPLAKRNAFGKLIQLHPERLLRPVSLSSSGYGSSIASADFVLSYPRDSNQSASRYEVCQFSTSHGRSAKSGSTTRKKVASISFEKEYDIVLKQLVGSNLPVLVKHIDQVNLKPKTRGANDTNELLESMLDDDYEVNEVIRQFARLQNRNYQEIKEARRQVERFKTPVSDYQLLLKSLYPTSGSINLAALYRGYQSLPTPRPLHLLPQHLEDLLSTFMDGKTPESRNIYTNLIQDIEDCGLPVSEFEYTTSALITVKSFLSETRNPSANTSSTMHKIERLREQLEQVNNKSISSTNLFYQFGLKSRQQEIVNESVKEFQNGKFRPNRVTMMISIMNEGSNRNIDGIKSLYETLFHEGYLIDISVVNVVLKAFLLCQQAEQAEVLYQSIVSQSKLRIAPGSTPDFIPSNSVLLKKAILIDYVVQILKSNHVPVNVTKLRVPLIPDEFTYLNMLTHYSRKGGDLNRCLSVFEDMNRLGFEPTFPFYMRAYSGFRRNQKSTSSWNRNGLKVLTQILCDHYQRISKRTPLSTKSANEGLTHVNKIFNSRLLRRVIKSYKTTYWEVPQQVFDVEAEIFGDSSATVPATTTVNNKSGKPVIAPSTVYRALTKLIEIA
jgi:hypothetical protein